MIRRLLALARHHAIGDPPARAGESAARIVLYPTEARATRRQPQTTPRTVLAAGARSTEATREYRAE